MKKMTSAEIREEWLKFFESKGHLRVESKSLIPLNDPSLLWINSGVATLKDFFSGRKTPPRNRLTNSQKSIRTNDIENVGVTSRHHTLFEMLGNFSIGDYFKDEAIEFAWEFLTKILEMDPQKLYITYNNEDEKTYKKWQELGVDQSNLIPGDRKTNFWDMGMGPCGPNTEIFFDRGERFDKRGVELIEKDTDNDRYIEIWNIVFSEFNNDGNNNYTELSQKNIDTGAGLERIVSILQSGYTNFDTDLFLPIIEKVEELSGKRYDGENYFVKDEKQSLLNKHFRIISDHMRAIVNAISDGAKPSNVSRGYIIRRLLRRAYRSGIRLEINKETFLHEIVDVVINTLPFKIDAAKVIESIKKEEELFAKTINKGEELLAKTIVKGQEFDFAIAFKLFETYGFPIELTQEILAEKGIKLDISKFNEYLEKHANVSRGNVASAMQKQIKSLTLIEEKISEFIGYEFQEGDSKVLMLLNEEREVDEIIKEGFVLIKQTPFYATSGGQGCDRGYIEQDGNRIEVIDVFKDKFGNHIHKVKGNLKRGDVKLFIDKKVREGMMRNHSGTHLVFKALREVFGSNKIEQLGSDITEKRFRFDFPSDSKPSNEQVEKVENLVNEYISKDVIRNYIISDLKGAEDLGAIMTIDEDQYSDLVRIVEFPKITIDLCGGTHVANTGFLEAFKIISIDNKGTGKYRIEAITSKELVDKWIREKIELLSQEMNNILNKNKKLDKEYSLNLEVKSISECNSILRTLREDNKKLRKNSNDIEVPILENLGEIHIDLGFKNNEVKKIAVSLREKHPATTFVIGSKSDKTLIAIASKVKDCGKVFRELPKEWLPKGGGAKEFAQGVIENNDNINSIIKGLING